MDETISVPDREVDRPFLMTVDGSLNIPGRGTVATGTVERGSIKNGADVQLIGMDRKPVSTTITGIETFRKTLDTAEAGDNVGMLLRGLTRE